MQTPTQNPYVNTTSTPNPFVPQGPGFTPWQTPFNSTSGWTPWTTPGYGPSNPGLNGTPWQPNTLFQNTGHGYTSGYAGFGYPGFGYGSGGYNTGYGNGFVPTNVWNVPSYPVNTVPSFGSPYPSPFFGNPMYQPGFTTSGQYSPNFNTPNFNTPNFNTPGFNTPNFNTPGFNMNSANAYGYSTPNSFYPGFSNPNFNTPGFINQPWFGGGYPTTSWQGGFYTPAYNSFNTFGATPWSTPGSPVGGWQGLPNQFAWTGQPYGSNSQYQNNPFNASGIWNGTPSFQTAPYSQSFEPGYAANPFGAQPFSTNGTQTSTTCASRDAA